jgi:hypothetical protein
MRKLVARLALTVAAMALFPSPVAHAEPRPSPSEIARAKSLKAAGDTAMESLKYSDALAAYTEAHALTGDAALLYNKGQALRALERFPEALAELERFEQTAPPALKAKVPKLGELIAEVRGRITVLTLACNVEGARVLVRDKLVGTTPLSTPLRLASGKAAVEVSADGYEPFRQVVDLPGGGSTEIGAKLISKDTTGVLFVTTGLAGAEAFVDGKPVGSPPVEVVVPSGDHRIRVVRDGFDVATTTAVVAAGERKHVAIALQAKRPPTSKGWFWASVAAGAATVAGVVIAGALLIDRPTSKGDIPPGQVSAPLMKF